MKSWNLFTLKPLRFLAVAFCCAVLILSMAYPSYAESSAKSSPTDGTVQLSDIEKQAQKVAQKPLSPQAYQARSQGGLNEVQGSADVDKMNRSDDTQQADTVLDKIKDGLDNITHKS